MKKRLCLLLCLLLVLLLGCQQESGDVSVIKTTTNVTNEESTITNELQKARVVRVVDGDTVIVKILWKEYRVRLIGVDTPESVNPDMSKNTEAGKRASDYTKSQLVENTIVYLQQDESDTDKYGRLLRYIWLADDVDIESQKDIETYMYNAILLKKGYAKPMIIEPNTAYEDMFNKIYYKYYKG